MNKHDVIIQEVENLKRKGVKAIKFEFEAVFGRLDPDADCECDDNTCHECMGNWEGDRCENECDNGRLECPECGGTNEVTRTLDDGQRITEHCEECSEDGYDYCDECQGNGWYENCEYCDEGHVDRDCECTAGKYSETSICQEFIMGKLAEHGLAERPDDRHTYTPVLPLVFGKFYYDHSVDSEFTCTLSLENSEDIFLAPKLMQAFLSLGEEINNGVNTDNAGLHISLVFGEGGAYPTNPTSTNTERFKNFRKSMQLLVPALYFLGTTNENTRGLNYRKPRISCEELYMGDKYSAIWFSGNALEFRVFDTCYDNPELLLDYVCVMSRTMRFWSDKRTEPSISKRINTIKFGVDVGDKLERLYMCEEHLDVLNYGIGLLKPKYYTIGELKKQRNFKTTKSVIKQKAVAHAKEAETKYVPHINRLKWEQLLAKQRQTVRELEDITLRRSIAEEPPTAELLDELNKNAEKIVKDHMGKEPSLEEFIATQVELYKENNMGRYLLGKEA
jgi:hypothetical protein